MMTRHAVALLALGLLACTTDKTAAPPAPKRTQIVPAPGVYGHEFSKDGKRVSYGFFVGGNAAVFVANADGTGARRVSFGVWDYDPFFSPDGKLIMFRRDQGGQDDVLIVPSDSGAERPVAVTSADEEGIAWLPDGSGVVFTKAEKSGIETWVYNVADGKSAKEIDDDGSVVGYPSPDGKSFAYTHTKGGNSTVWLWDREKKTKRQLTTEGFESVNQYTFSPDGKSILYRSGRTGTGDVWRLDLATGEKKQLTKDIAEDNNSRWSPDGSRVLFQSNRGGQPDLWVLTNDESDVQRLTDDVVVEQDMQWARDGNAVTVAVPLGVQHLYSLPLAGGTPVALTSGNWTVTQAHVSHDGSLVAYTGTKNGDEDIWLVKSTGGESRLLSGAPGFDGAANIAPDNKHVVFTSVRSGNLDLWIAPVDSGPAVQLTNWPSTETSGSWSPDGKTILFVSNHESGSFDLWTVPATGGTPTRLTHTGNIIAYRWHPDGKSIVFAAQEAAGPAVMVISASGGQPKQVAPPTSFNPSWSRDGKELAVMQCDGGYCTMDILTPDGKPLRVAPKPRKVYEFSLDWSNNGQQTLVGWQDLKTDGGNRVDLRPRAGGEARTLAAPAGHSVNAVGFGDSDRVAIVLSAPNGNALQRIEVPAAPVKKP